MTTHQDYDVVIAGGGPAGLSAAQVAAATGLRVLVAEKRAEIGSPTRTSGGSFVADLRALGVPAHLYHPLQGCWLIGPSGEARFRTPNTVGCVLNVRALYQYLAQEAVGAGAVLSPRTLVLGVDRLEPARQSVRLRDRTGRERRVSCSLVVDASGFSSTLAVQAGIHRIYRRVGVGAEYDLYAPNFPEDTCVLVVGSSIAPNGYAWAFPYGDHRVRAGVGVLRSDGQVDPADFLDHLVGRYSPLREAFIGASPVEFHTGVIPADGMNARLVSDGLMTAGDSAGQASTLAGEGIRYSIYAGRLAGRIGAEAVGRGDVSAAALSRYETEWNRRFGRDLRLGYILSRRLYSSSDAEWDAAVHVLSGLSATSFGRVLATDLSPGLLLRVAVAALRRPRAARTLVPLLLRKPRPTPSQPASGESQYRGV